MKLLKTRDSRRRNWVVSEWVAKEGGKERQQQQHTKKKKAPKEEENHWNGAKRKNTQESGE